MKKIILALFVVAACSTQDFNFGREIPADAVFARNGDMYRTGLVVPVGIKPPKQFSEKLLLGLPEEFDWRKLHELAPIEDQGNCGACWAFATTATFQDVMRITKGEKFDLSEQYLLSCASPGRWTCKGGFFAHDQHMVPKGAVMAYEYPYTGSDSACRQNIIYRWKLTSWKYIAEKPTVEQIKTAIYKHGPVAVAISADSAFTNYRGGVFQGTTATALNHAVNIVGWGKGHWIIRNSWGQSWGEKGWGRIRFGANAIGSWANYVVYDSLPVPTPEPEPSPTPSPTPVPPPVPTPEPAPVPTFCEPQPYADTGTTDIVQVRRGQSITLGMQQPRKDTVYFWLATPHFDQLAVAQSSSVRFQPSTSKTLKFFAVTRCGMTSDSVTVQMIQ